MTKKYTVIYCLDVVTYHLGDEVLSKVPSEGLGLGLGLGLGIGSLYRLSHRVHQITEDVIPSVFYRVPFFTVAYCVLFVNRVVQHNNFDYNRNSIKTISIIRDIFEISKPISFLCRPKPNDKVKEKI